MTLGDIAMTPSRNHQERLDEASATLYNVITHADRGQLAHLYLYLTNSCDAGHGVVFFQNPGLRDDCGVYATGIPIT